MAQKVKVTTRNRVRKTGGNSGYMLALSKS